MNVVLGFVFLLCLLLLVMIFGEQLSIFGGFYGRWFGALSEFIADLWNSLCEGIDRVWCFVLKHLWWVLAVGSGSAGVLIIAWMLFGGIADHAAANLAQRSGRLNAGGTLDGPTELQPSAESASFSHPHRTLPASHVVYQEPSNRPLDVDWNLGQDLVSGRETGTPGRSGSDDAIPSPSDIRERDYLRRGFQTLDDLTNRDSGPLSEDHSDLETLEPERRIVPRRRTPLFSRHKQEKEDSDLDDDSIVEIAGIVTTSGTLKNEIASALRQLRFTRQDDWKRREQLPDRSIDFLNLATELFSVHEATADELDSVKSRVRIVPGIEVGASDLYIEKSMAAAEGGNSFEIEIRVTNQSQQPMSGLLIYERLPYQLKPVSIGQRGVYRDSTVTWVVDDLLPLKQKILRVRVRSESGRSFTPPHTVISAVAAVASEVVVGSERPTDYLRDRPDVRLTVGDFLQVARLSDNVEIPFQLSNVGSQTAAEVFLRIDLPRGLFHRDITDADVDRRVSLVVRDLEPNTSRVKMLKVRVAEVGEHLAVVEFLVSGCEPEFTTFRIRVRDDAENDTKKQQPFLPETSEPRRTRRRPAGELNQATQ
ncbi:MAG: hypothetical protein MK102_04515 [Fuerstiella sp.]|nr:hypothetical protein [Fuerstiella sp.]